MTPQALFSGNLRMTTPLPLLFGVHAHQPVGNFDAVIDDAHERCYRPFLHTLHRYPAFRFAAHFSGWLLDRLAARHPQDMALLGDMVARGQVEMFGAGDCEPVLAAIPARDRASQLHALSHKLEARFGARPTGAWLTERVWEPSVVPALAAAGIRYVMVDDYHLLATGREPAELDGFLATEEDGASVDLFPISEALRYRLPFSPAEDAVQWLEAQAAAGMRAAIYFDDIEKFGIWPDTWDWVYGRGWLESFIEGVLASPVLVPQTYAGFHARNRARGIVYLPTVSYSEMNEWTLPPAAARRYAALREQAAPADRPFLRGGIWRNFLSRYPEANWMHKRMLGLSARLAGSAQSGDPALRELLHAAQANDAYWHGLFGGLYLPHLRRAVWRSLLALEARLDEEAPARPAGRSDVDFDGLDECFIANGELQVVVRDDGLGAAHELSSYVLTHNFGDTLRRYPEHYHRTSEGPPPLPTEPAQDGIASAHDRKLAKTTITEADLATDPAGRLFGTEELVDASGHARPLREWRLVSCARDRLAFTGLAGAAEIRKVWALGGHGLHLAYEGDFPVGSRLRLALHLAMPSCDGFGGRYVLADGGIPGGFGTPLLLEPAHQLSLEDAELGGRVTLYTDAASRWEAAPLRTVSQSEAGLEKIMQGVAIQVLLAPGARRLWLRLERTASWL